MGVWAGRSAKILGAILLLVLALPRGASGQAIRTWVSGVGDDANPCSRTAPCKTFAGAISKTAAGGEINCLDAAGYGAITITKSITIDCARHHGGITNAGTSGVIVSGANIKVRLRGLDINGGGSTVAAVTGVRVLQAKRVAVIDSQIYSQRDGVELVESAGVGTRVVLKNVEIFGNSRHGVHAAPVANRGDDWVSTARVMIRHSLISGNDGCGVVASSRGPATGDARTDCGASRTGVAGTVQVSIFDSEIVDHETPPITPGSTNGGTAVFSIGSRSTIYIGNNVITGNNVGLRSIDAGTVGGIRSFRDNYVFGNRVNGSPTGTVGRI